MSANPRLSVLMPAYNASAYVGEAIGSILTQTFRDFELLILDDCSTDNTLNVAKSFDDKRIRILSNSTNLGYLKSCNKLFNQANGDFITFQDADDYSVSNRFTLQLEAFASDQTLGMAGTWANIVDVHGNFIRSDNRAESYEEIKNALLVASQFNGATIMIKREVLKEIGGYKDFFCQYGNEDYDWSFRIAERFKSINVGVPLYNYRQSASGISKQISIERAISDDVVKYLASQRAKHGADDLMTGQTDALAQIVAALSKPYQLDPSLLSREYASAYMYSRLFKSALAAAWSAVRLEPTLWVNWRTLQYCLRKSLLSFLKV
jgi:glycosyltransferase involved in cell wall biosynthesis